MKQIIKFIDVACKHLESEGYMCDYISEDATIEF